MAISHAVSSLFWDDGNPHGSRGECVGYLFFNSLFLTLVDNAQNRDYRCVSGVKRKEETWEAGVEAGTIKIADDDHKQKLETGP